MSGTDGNTIQRETRRRAAELKKTPASNSETGMDNDEPDASMANLIAQNVTEKISALMELKFAELQSSLTILGSRIDDNSKRLTEAESRISENEDRTSSLENKVAHLEQKVKSLADRTEASENRSRRDNIRIIGLKEGTEGKNAVIFFETWLHDTLDLKTKRGFIKIDRAHRALGPRKSNSNRPVIIKLHNYGDKQVILSATREKGDILDQGNKIYIRQDLSAAVREARRKFNDTCEQLIQRGIRFQMRYPATLFLTVQGELHSFETPQEVEKFMSRTEGLSIAES